MYVKVLHPADIGDIYVSAHMEYQRPAGEWVPVPTNAGPLGKEYTSPRYPGLRDYVSLRKVTENTERHISLFMPYDAAAMPTGSYAASVRYQAVGPKR